MRFKSYLFFFIFSCLPTLATAVNFSGKIETDGKKLKTFNVSINSKQGQFKRNKFELEVPDKEIYQIKIEAEGYYPSIQTFSHFELQQNSKNEIKHIKLPPIQLVEKKKKRTMFAFVGDAMMTRRFMKPYFDEDVLISDDVENQTKALLKHVKPYLEIADHASVNLETQINVTEPKTKAPKSIRFYSPPEMLDALSWAGIDYVTLGNNHIYDYLDDGLEQTLKYLQDSKLSYSGAGMNQQQALKAHVETINHQPYSFLGYLGWAGNSTPNQIATIDKGGSAFGDMKNIIQSVARESHLGHGVVIQYHGSLEYSQEPTAVTESRLKAAIDHGADLVLAHHPHVTQGFELYNNKLIAYSLGNFVFDQYYYSTPHSYILYVWMDGEDFHKAEIVPIYLKGYKPTPATGKNRQNLSQRSNYLSQKRGVRLHQSGGHLTILPNNLKPSKHKLKLNIPANHKNHGIQNLLKPYEIHSIQTAQKHYRLGKNLLNNSDFEAFNTFESPERGFYFHHSEVTQQQAKSGKNAIELFTNSSPTSEVGMRYFRRVYDASSPMTVNANIKTNQNLNAKLYIQYRKTRDKFFAAFDNKKILVDEKRILASSIWQNIDLDFNLRRVGFRGFRFVLEFEKVDNSDNAAVFIDDLSLIQWQAHFNQAKQMPMDEDLSFSATHIGLKEKTKRPIEFQIEFLE